MNITFTPQPIPELTIDGGILAVLGFTPGTPLQLTLRPDGLWIIIATDEAIWEAVCEASQHRYDLNSCSK